MRAEDLRRAAEWVLWLGDGGPMPADWRGADGRLAVGRIHEEARRVAGLLSVEADRQDEDERAREAWAAQQERVREWDGRCAQCGSREHVCCGAGMPF